jgi:hypothetical protein
VSRPPRSRAGGEGSLPPRSLAGENKCLFPRDRSRGEKCLFPRGRVAGGRSVSSPCPRRGGEEEEVSSSRPFRGGGGEVSLPRKKKQARCFLRLYCKVCQSELTFLFLLFSKPNLIISQATIKGGGRHERVGGKGGGDRRASFPRVRVAEGERDHGRICRGAASPGPLSSGLQGTRTRTGKVPPPREQTKVSTYILFILLLLVCSRRLPLWTTTTIARGFCAKSWLFIHFLCLNL